MRNMLCKTKNKGNNKYLIGLIQVFFVILHFLFK